MQGTELGPLNVSESCVAWVVSGGPLEAGPEFIPSVHELAFRSSFLIEGYLAQP